MLIRFEIKGSFPSLNEFYRYDHHKQGRIKRQCDELVMWSAKAAHVPKFTRPVMYRVRWVEQSHRRDLDNIAFGKKFIQDGLVKAGVLQGDSYKFVKGFEDRFDFDAKNPRIEVEIWEAL